MHGSLDWRYARPMGNDYATNHHGAIGWLSNAIQRSSSAARLHQAVALVLAEVGWK